MGFFDGIKRVLNVGGAELRLFTEFETYHQGEDLSGEVEVVGGDIAQHADALTLSLVEFWTERRTTGVGKNRRTRTVTVTKTWQTETLATPCPVEPDSVQRFNFTVSLPDNGRISTRSTGWRIDINLDVPGALDPNNTVRIAVEPALEILRVAQVIEERMHFREELSHRHWYRSDGLCRLRFQPPPPVQPHLDYLELSVARQPDGSVAGAMRFDLQEQKFMDYLKAIINTDGKSYDLIVPPELVDEDFTPEDEGKITRLIVAPMEELLGERDAL